MCSKLWLWWICCDCRWKLLLKEFEKPFKFGKLNLKNVVFYSFAIRQDENGDKYSKNLLLLGNKLINKLKDTLLYQLPSTDIPCCPKFWPTLFARKNSTYALENRFLQLFSRTFDYQLIHFPCQRHVNCRTRLLFFHKVFVSFLLASHFKRLWTLKRMTFLKALIRFKNLNVIYLLLQIYLMLQKIVWENLHKVPTCSALDELWDFQ